MSFICSFSLFQSPKAMKKRLISGTDDDAESPSISGSSFKDVSRQNPSRAQGAKKEMILSMNRSDSENAPVVAKGAGMSEKGGAAGSSGTNSRRISSEETDLKKRLLPLLRCFDDYGRLKTD